MFWLEVKLKNSSFLNLLTAKTHQLALGHVWHQCIYTATVYTKYSNTVIHCRILNTRMINQPIRKACCNTSWDHVTIEIERMPVTLPEEISRNHATALAVTCHVTSVTWDQCIIDKFREWGLLSECLPRIPPLDTISVHFSNVYDWYSTFCMIYHPANPKQWVTEQKISPYSLLPSQHTC